MLNFFPRGQVRDSKKLSPLLREKIYKSLVVEEALGRISFSVSLASARLIDEKGITFAIRLALSTALAKLRLKPSEAEVLLDGGLKAPKDFQNQKTIIKGDEKEAVIALASIVAKVSRDRKMQAFARKFPGYGFEIHKGYGTRRHYEALAKNGLCPIHRQSFLKSLK